MIPDDYKQLSEEEVRRRILATKARLGKRLVILGHHYQRDEVVALSDFQGDSFGLCQKAAEQTEAEFIVFCGVHFMAEAADIVSNDNQLVHLPDLTAGCPLADFADLTSVLQAWNEMSTICGQDSVTPITYINSSAEIKAFCGENQGSVCTSSNALAAMNWGFNRSDKIFFFPDQHLGANTANRFGIKTDQRIIWDPDQSLGGNSPEKIKQARLILWKGHCHVHTRFNLSHIQTIRNSYPQAKIVVHPECPEPVVDAADDSGSTSYIIKYVEQASPGTVIAIGTELNLVHRMAKRHRDKTVIPLARSLCPNMYKINLYNLCFTLDHIGEVNTIKVSEEIKASARLALDRMLQLK